MAAEPVTADKAAPKKRGCPCSCLGVFLCAAIVVILCFIALGPIGPGNAHPMESAAMQKARMIDLLLFSWSNDNDQQYPTGKSSTEIFQMLLDQKYVEDPSTFYLPLPGKVPPVDGEKLKPENVGFDVTSGIVADSSDLIPVVFETGYKVTYAPGAAAVPANGPEAPSVSRTWTQWWNSEKPMSRSEGIAVGYKSNSAMFLKARADTNPPGAAPGFISPEFKPDGKSYQQLTPEGAVP